MNQNISAAVTAVIHQLLKNPDVAEKIREEFIEEIFGELPTVEQLEKELTMESIKDLDYLNQVVKESLRISPSIYGKVQVPQKDIELEGFTLKEGTRVFPCAGVMGVSDNIFAEPEKFIPARFDTGSDYFKLPDGGKRDPMTWNTFGNGPRVCQGMGYSVYQIKLCVVYLLSQYKLELEGELPENDHYYFATNADFKVKYTKL